MPLNRRGITYVELLVAALLMTVAAGAVISTWNISTQAAAGKRDWEMGVYIAMTEMERLKAQKYMSLLDTPSNAPNIRYYNRYGAPVGGAANR
ncbi:MAG TPA: type II secretion system protein, partial [Chthonomonadales bacterium]|nr:type II secretion system protein [Chthonomonadales bacterium]